MPQITPNFHDQNFKSLMSESVFFRGFMKAYLPENLIIHLDCSTLEISKPDRKIFEPKTHKIFEADLVYCLKNKDYLILIHIEHQSSPDKNMPFRMAHYQTAQIASYMKDIPHQENPPEIISFIYYQGEKPWPYQTIFNNLSPGLICLIDLAAISDDALLSHESIGKIELLLKYIKHKDHKNKLEKILPGLQTCNDNVREILLKYLSSVTDFTEDEFLDLVNNCLPKDEGVAMTLMERLIQKGEKRGLEKSIDAFVS